MLEKLLNVNLCGSWIVHHRGKIDSFSWNLMDERDIIGALAMCFMQPYNYESDYVKSLLDHPSLTVNGALIILHGAILDTKNEELVCDLIKYFNLTPEELKKIDFSRRTPNGPVMLAKCINLLLEGRGSFGVRPSPLLGRTEFTSN